MEEQQLDGIVLAAAGLKRLGMEDVITQYLAPEDMISAPAQGALALEVREDQKELQKMLDVFCDEETMNEVCAERNFLEQMEGQFVRLRQVPDVKRQIKGMNYMLCLEMKMETNRHTRKFMGHDPEIFSTNGRKKYQKTAGRNRLFDRCRTGRSGTYHGQRKRDLKKSGLRHL